MKILDILINKLSLIKEDNSNQNNNIIIININRTNRSETRNEGLKPVNITLNKPENSTHKDSTPDEFNTSSSITPSSPPPIQV